jgi:hypothetical protein
MAKNAMTLGTAFQIRHKAFDLKQPNFEVAQNRLQVVRALAYRVKTCGRHSEE